MAANLPLKYINFVEILFNDDYLNEPKSTILKKNKFYQRIQGICKSQYTNSSMNKLKIGINALVISKKTCNKDI